MFGQHRLLDAAQIETLTARQYGDRHLADLSRRENEANVCRRLFERLQKGVESALRQHVDFVDHKDFDACHERHVLRAFDDLADIIDARVGGRVDFEHVRVAAFHDVLAVDTKASCARGMSIVGLS